MAGQPAGRPPAREVVGRALEGQLRKPASKAVLSPKQIERASYTPPFHSQPSGNLTEECSRCCTLSATFPDKRDIPKKPLKRGTDERHPSGGPPSGVHLP